MKKALVLVLVAVAACSQAQKGVVVSGKTSKGVTVKAVKTKVQTVTTAKKHRKKFLGIF